MTARCTACGRQYEPSPLMTICPACHGKVVQPGEQAAARGGAPLRPRPQRPTAPAEHVVIQADVRPLDPAVLAPILGRELGMHPVDAAATVTRARGIICRVPDSHTAQRIAAALSSAGVPVRVMPADEVIRPPAATEARGARFLEDVFEAVVDVHGNIAPMRWAEVSVLACAAIKVTERVPREFRATATQGLATAPSQPHRAGKERERLRFVLDMLRPDPPLRLRVDAASFDYRGLGGTPAEGSAANFQRLVAHVHRMCPRAVSNLRMSQQAGLPVKPPEYTSIYELDALAMWLMCLATLRRPERRK